LKSVIKQHFPGLISIKLGKKHEAFILFFAFLFCEHHSDVARNVVDLLKRLFTIDLGSDFPFLVIFTSLFSRLLDFYRQNASSII